MNKKPHGYLSQSVRQARTMALPKINRRQRRAVQHAHQIVVGHWLTAEHGNDGYQIVSMDCSRVMLAGGYFLTIDQVLRDWYISPTLPTGYVVGQPDHGLDRRSRFSLNDLVCRKMTEREDAQAAADREARTLPLLNRGVPS